MTAFKYAIIGAALAALTAAPMPAAAQSKSMPKATYDTMHAMHGGTLTVTSYAFKNMGMFPMKYTQFGANESPPLTWTKGPAGTKSYVVLVEDTGVHMDHPIYHWVLYNVPPDTTHLYPNIATDPIVTWPRHAMNGLNIAHKVGYMGPRPPMGQTHPYHFEVFALNTMLSIKPDKATHDAVVAAMKGHVLAKGEIIGMYKHEEMSGGMHKGMKKDMKKKS